MKGKKEDDDSKPKSANESMRVNQFADLLVHVELEQLPNCSRFQLKQAEEVACLMGFTILQLLNDSSFFRAYLWWFFVIFMNKFLLRWWLWWWLRWWIKTIDLKVFTWLGSKRSQDQVRHSDSVDCDTDNTEFQEMLNRKLPSRYSYETDCTRNCFSCNNNV